MISCEETPGYVEHRSRAINSTTKAISHISIMYCPVNKYAKCIQGKKKVAKQPRTTKTKCDTPTNSLYG